MARVWSHILLFLVAISELSADTDIYVSSTRGSDTHGDGSFQRPFASLQRGQRFVRDIVTRAQEGNIVVNVGAGTYFTPEPLTFTAEDSPARHGRTTYRGPPTDSNSGEQALVYGGISVPCTMWSKHTAHIWKANLSTILPAAPSPTLAPQPQRYPSVPLPPLLQLPFQVLVEGTEAAVLARTPERGSGYLRDLGCSVDDGTLTCPRGVLPQASTMQKNIADMSVFCNTGAGWDGETRAVEKLSSSSSGGVAVSYYAPSRTCGGDCNNKTYIQGSPVFITEPGEWAFDSKRTTLYYWPRDTTGVLNGTVSVVAATASRVLDVAGESFANKAKLATRLSFERLTIVGSDFSHNYVCDFWTRTPEPFREGMIRIENATDIEVQSLLERSNRSTEPSS